MSPLHHCNYIIDGVDDISVVISVQRVQFLRVSVEVVEYGRILLGEGSIRAACLVWIAVTTGSTVG